MRISILSIKLFPNYLTSIFLLMICSLPLGAQWVNNPALNTKIVTDGSNPINISSVEDLKGGAFIFWEDNKSKFQNDIYFVHMDGNGKVSTRADGKKVSDNYGNKINPIASSNMPNTAVVVWKDYSKNKNGNLFAQRVFVNGNLMWQKDGVQVTPDFPDVTDYSACSDGHGDVYISYIAKADEFRSSYKLILQKVGVEGQLKKSIDGILINDSPGIKSF